MLVASRGVLLGRTLRQFCTSIDPIISYETFEKLRKTKTGTLIDVREPQELTEFGAIPETVNIPLGEVESALKMDPERFEKIFKAAKPSEDEPLVFFCKIGKRSGIASEIAKANGFNAGNFIGSFEEWKEKQGQ